MEPAGSLALDDMKENDCCEWKLTTVGPKEIKLKTCYVCSFPANWRGGRGVVTGRNRVN